MKITNLGNGKISIEPPFNPNFVSKIKKAGGRWNPGNKTWEIDERSINTVRAIMREVYGQDDSMIKKNVIIPGAEARRLAETLVEEDADIFEVVSGLELLGIPTILAQAIVESVLPLDDDEDNVFEEFLNLLNEYTTIQW